MKLVFLLYIPKTSVHPVAVLILHPVIEVYLVWYKYCDHRLRDKGRTTNRELVEVSYECHRTGYENAQIEVGCEISVLDRRRRRNVMRPHLMAHLGCKRRRLTV